MRYLILILLFFAPVAEASEPLYLSVVPVEGGGVRVSAYVSGTEAPVNAVEGILLLPEGSDVGAFHTGASVVGYWVETPSVFEEGIRFSGIMPGGFTGVAAAGEGLTGDGLLFSFDLPTLSGEVILSDAAVYLSDGSGTRVSVRDAAYARTESGPVVAFSDRTPPEWIEVRRIRDPLIAEGKVVLVMDASDLGSGIARFEVREWGGAWKRAGSPYELSDSLGAFFMSVRAYDHAGNYRETTLPPEPLMMLVEAGILLLVVFLVFIGARKRNLC